MPYTNLKFKAAATVLTLAASAFCISAPASAGLQDDVQSCRVAMTAQSNIDMSAYRLRYEWSRGYRTRILHLKAIPTKGGQSFRFSCTLNRDNTIALNHTGGARKFALLKS